MKTTLTEQERLELYIKMFIEAISNIPIEIVDDLYSQLKN